MKYNNMLNMKQCSICPAKDFCFLRQMPLQNYPEVTQNFVIHLPSNIFAYSRVEHRWHTHYKFFYNNRKEKISGYTPI